MNPDAARSQRLFSAAFYTLLATVVLAPLAFWPTQYFVLDSVKTLVIGLLSCLAAAFVLVLGLRERSLRLPPKSMTYIGIALALSILLSSAFSGHFITSFFGQGFEIGAGAFIVALLLAGFTAFSVVSRKPDRAIVLYAGIVAAFLILFVFQAVRLANPSFATLGFLDSPTASLVGSWSSFGMFAAAISLISIAAALALPLSRRMKAVYWILFAISIAATLIVVNVRTWSALSLAFAGLAVFLSFRAPSRDGAALSRLLSRISWIPVAAAAAMLFLSLYGSQAMGALATRLDAGYTEIALPWQMTMDVASGELQQSPILGAGPNRFSEAYLANKPAGINQTDYWGIEFTTGFGLIPTFFVTQGFLGMAVWVAFFVFFGILGVASLRGLSSSESAPADPERRYARFVMISSFTAAAFLWLVSIAYLPSHAVFYLAFVLTGIWLGSSVAYGRLAPVSIPRGTEPRRFGTASIAITGVAALAAVLLAVTFAKNGVALAYFGEGIKDLNMNGDAVSADKDFAAAIALDPIDAYWRSRAEAGAIRASSILSSASGQSQASTTAAVAHATAILSQASSYAAKAVAADPDAYTNYLAVAHVDEVAAAIKSPDAYANGVAAYVDAIRRNPENPSIYLDLARFQASQNDVDKAIQTIGAALQVKSNYIDGVYMLSQLEAAKGNAKDAITAAEFAISLNPNDPLLYFQLGLLEYSQADYGHAADAFASALKAQPDYANAAYFLGLSDARMGKTTDAIGIFDKLAQANPDNADVKSILSALRAGKPLFTSTSGATKEAVRPSKAPLRQK